MIQSSIERNEKYNLDGRVLRPFVVTNPLFGKRVGKSSANSPNVNGLVTTSYLKTQPSRMHIFMHIILIFIYSELKEKKEIELTNVTIANLVNRYISLA